MAPLADGLQNLGFLGLSVLAVAGGAVAGAALTAALVWLPCRLFARKQPPPAMRKLLRWLGGIAGALLVAGYLKFGGGTGWLFGEGGLGPGQGGQSTGEAALKQDKGKPSSKADETKAAAEQPLRADRVRVVILGGELVKVPNYYRIEGQPQPVDLKGVRDHIQRLQKSDPKLAGVDILIYRNSLYSNSDAVKLLKAQVAELGLTPNLVELNGDIPTNG
jgi:hypothetical protein